MAAACRLWTERPARPSRDGCRGTVLPGAPRPLRVLLVDDEPLLINALARLLRRAGNRVTAAADGVEALERLREERADVILSDGRMPQLDGPGLLRALRGDGDRTPRVFLTGDGDASDGDLVALGASEVLRKPVTLDRLLAPLHRVAGE